jgi:hypothetical protein
MNKVRDLYFNVDGISFSRSDSDCEGVVSGSSCNYGFISGQVITVDEMLTLMFMFLVLVTALVMAIRIAIAKCNKNKQLHLRKIKTISKVRDLHFDVYDKDSDSGDC